MKEITQFETHTVEIWRRPGQRHINLRVRPDGLLRVTCNRRVPKRDIEVFLRESEAFIKKCLAAIHEQKKKYPPKRFVTDERHLYLGQRLPLKIIWSWGPRIRMRAEMDHLEMIAPLKSTPVERQKALHKFLQKQARQVLPVRVAQFAEQMKLRPSSLAIRGQRTRWGSCSSAGRLNLNWKLMAVPPEVIDYVVIHELAHLRHMNHSPQFWDLVRTYFPTYKLAKKWLSANEAEIGAQFQKLP